MKTDIKNKEDIMALVDSFYGKVGDNEILGFIFDDVAQVNWVTHLPKMYDFWAGILLGENDFRGNPMLKHIMLSKRTEMSDYQFNEWLRLFHETVDEMYEGQLAEEAKHRANLIARNMLTRINQVLI
jgi:hemoglobin